MMEETDLLVEYRRAVKDLIECKSESSIFPRSEICVRIVLEELLESAQTSINILIAEESLKHFGESVWSRLRAKKNSLGATGFCMLSIADTLRGDERARGLLDSVVPPEIGKNMNELSFLLVDVQRLVVFEAKTRQVVFIPYSIEGLPAKCMQFFNALRKAIGFDDVDSRRGA